MEPVTFMKKSLSNRSVLNSSKNTFSSASSLVRRALAFSRERHKGQIRKGGGLPFITHPIQVAKLLEKAGMSDHVIAAGLLHDVLEDTKTTPGELRGHFGSWVARLVQDVTEVDKRLPWEERKAAYVDHLKTVSLEALAISCADKLHNTESLIVAYVKEGPRVFSRFSRGIKQKVAHHRMVFEMVRQRWPDCPLLPDLDRAILRLEAISKKHRMPSPHLEVEAKFLVKDRSVHDAVARLKRLDGFQIVRAARQRQRNSYFDTQDLHLRKARVILKLRQVGQKAEVTSKKELAYGRGISKRVEITVPIQRSAIPRLLKGQLDIEPVRRVRAAAGDRSIRKIFTLLTDRRVRVLALGKHRIELDIDRVTVLKGRKIVARHLEVEVENKTASADIYQEAIAALRRRFGKGLRPSRTWKAEYGFRLL